MLEARKKGTWFLDKYGEKVPISFRGEGFQLGDKHLILASFQNIHSEMEETEMESWEKLIRVLTHEVSNSVTPIATLGSNIRKRLHSAGKAKTGQISLSGDLANDIVRSAELIEQRGNGLIDFISQYKTFMRLPEPDIRKINLKELIDDACRLGENLESASSCNINCSVEPPGIHCLADRKMIEQVLLNLVRNALEAIPEGREGLIDITGRILEPGFASVQVKDNGTGIPSEILDQVFIPFFTTKEKGSGIGLSFCRRIISMNGGSIRIKSTSEAGTIVNITLPTAIS
jgi:nitrogen fixation/metabolism regulation signal transduction histidine kinase